MTNFSPIPFPSNTPLQNLKIVATDKTIYIAPGWTGSAGKTGSAGSWTGQTLGNDTTGDGTIGKPFATLKKAWEVAQENVITGDATLYIQFQKGIYDLNGGTTHDNFFPDNLYHPQGGNIIIQGDPAAVKQKYLWRVANYTWDLAKFSHWGHTGEVYLWNTGGTAHGFTAEDDGGYVAISNVSLGSADWYKDNSSSSAGNNFQDTRYEVKERINTRLTAFGNWGNHFFSHEYRHQDGEGIVGFAKIYGATASVDVLKLVFKNQNFDSRSIGFYEDTPSTHAGRIAPGISNSGPWAGITASWPESQLAKPNGYYGQATGRNTSYPAVPSGVTHITNEIFTVTNYPVVIRSGITAFTNKIPLCIRGGKIKAIRNLFFTTAAVDGVSSGAQSLSYSLKEVTPDIKTPAPDCIVLDDMAEARIRHIGIAGYGNAILVSGNSTLQAYSETGVDNRATSYVGHDAGSEYYSANSSSKPLDNTPILMVNLCRAGILANGKSTVDLSLGNGRMVNNLTDSSVWMQVLNNGIVSQEESTTTIGSAWINQISGLPCFRLTLNIPVFGGSTSGLSAGFYNPESWDYNTYRDVRFFITQPGAGGLHLDYMGRIYGVAAGVTFQTDSTEGSGWTGSTWTKTAGFSETQPLYTQRVNFYGYALNGKYMAHPTSQSFVFGGRYVDFRKHITDGHTFEIRAFSDQPGTNYVSGLCFNNNSLSLRSQNGSYIIGTTASRGFTASVSKYSFINGGTRSGGHYMYGGCQGDTVVANRHGSLQIIKMLNIKGGGNGLVAGEGSNITTTFRNTAIMTTETAHSALRFDEKSTGDIGNVFIKNIHPGWEFGGRCDGLTVRMGSRVWHKGNMAALLWPTTNKGAIPVYDNSVYAGYGYWGDALTYFYNSYWGALLRVEGWGVCEFSGWHWATDAGWELGHRVSARDGRAANVTENATLSSDANGGLPVIVCIGNGHLSPVFYLGGGQIQTNSTNGDLYSFSHMLDTATSGASGTPIATRKPFGVNQFPMNCASGNRYQWWLNTKYANIDGTLFKVPIMITGTDPKGPVFATAAYYNTTTAGVLWSGLSVPLLGYRSARAGVYNFQPNY